MSIEGLRSEVRANLPISLAVKAADQLFSHAQRVYTNVSTEATTHNKGGHGGRYRGGNRRNSHHNSNPVRDAIDDARKTLDEVRGKGGRAKQNSRSRNREFCEVLVLILEEKLDLNFAGSSFSGEKTRALSFFAPAWVGTEEVPKVQPELCTLSFRSADTLTSPGFRPFHLRRHRAGPAPNRSHRTPPDPGVAAEGDRRAPQPLPEGEFFFTSPLSSK